MYHPIGWPSRHRLPTSHPSLSVLDLQFPPFHKHTQSPFPSPLTYAPVHSLAACITPDTLYIYTLSHGECVLLNYHRRPFQELVKEGENQHVIWKDISVRHHTLPPFSEDAVVSHSHSSSPIRAANSSHAHSPPHSHTLSSSSSSTSVTLCLCLTTTARTVYIYHILFTDHPTHTSSSSTSTSHRSLHNNTHVSLGGFSSIGGANGVQNDDTDASGWFSFSKAGWHDNITINAPQLGHVQIDRVRAVDISQWERNQETITAVCAYAGDIVIAGSRSSVAIIGWNSGQLSLVPTRKCAIHSSISENRSAEQCNISCSVPLLPSYPLPLECLSKWNAALSKTNGCSSLIHMSACHELGVIGLVWDDGRAAVLHYADLKKLTAPGHTEQKASDISSSAANCRACRWLYHPAAQYASPSSQATPALSATRRVVPSETGPTSSGILRPSPSSPGLHARVGGSHVPITPAPMSRMIASPIPRSAVSDSSFCPAHAVRVTVLSFAVRYQKIAMGMSNGEVWLVSFEDVVSNTQHVLATPRSPETYTRVSDGSGSASGVRDDHSHSRDCVPSVPPLQLPPILAIFSLQSLGYAHLSISRRIQYDASSVGPGSRPSALFSCACSATVLRDREAITSDAVCAVSSLSWSPDNNALSVAWADAEGERERKKWGPITSTPSSTSIAREAQNNDRFVIGSTPKTFVAGFAIFSHDGVRLFCSLPPYEPRIDAPTRTAATRGSLSVLTGSHPAPTSMDVRSVSANDGDAVGSPLRMTSNGDIWGHGVRTIAWSPGGFSVLAIPCSPPVPPSGISPSDGQMDAKEQSYPAELTRLTLARSHGLNASSSEPSSTVLLSDSCIFLWQGRERVKANAETESSLAPPASSTEETGHKIHSFSADGEWERVQGPASYLQHNWPLMHCSLSENLQHIAVSGRTGMVVYSRASKRWRMFGNINQERKIRATALAWFGGFHLHSTASSPSHHHVHVDSIACVANVLDGTPPETHKTLVQTLQSRYHEVAVADQTDVFRETDRHRQGLKIGCSWERVYVSNEIADGGTPEVSKSAHHHKVELNGSHAHSTRDPIRPRGELLFFPHDHLDHSALLYSILLPHPVSVLHIVQDHLLVHLYSGEVRLYRVLFSHSTGRAVPVPITSAHMLHTHTRLPAETRVPNRAASASSEGTETNPNLGWARPKAAVVRTAHIGVNSTSTRQTSAHSNAEDHYDASTLPGAVGLELLCSYDTHNGSFAMCNWFPLQGRLWHQLLHTRQRYGATLASTPGHSFASPFPMPRSLSSDILAHGGTSATYFSCSDASSGVTSRQSHPFVDIDVSAWWYLLLLPSGHLFRLLLYHAAATDASDLIGVDSNAQSNVPPLATSPESVLSAVAGPTSSERSLTASSLSLTPITLLAANTYRLWLHSLHDSSCHVVQQGPTGTESHSHCKGTILTKALHQEVLFTYGASGTQIWFPIPRLALISDTKPVEPSPSFQLHEGALGKPPTPRLESRAATQPHTLHSDHPNARWVAHSLSVPAVPPIITATNGVRTAASIPLGKAQYRLKISLFPYRVQTADVESYPVGVDGYMGVMINLTCSTVPHASVLLSTTSAPALPAHPESAVRSVAVPTVSVSSSVATSISTITPSSLRSPSSSSPRTPRSDLMAIQSSVVSLNADNQVHGSLALASPSRFQSSSQSYSQLFGRDAADVNRTTVFPVLPPTSTVRSNENTPQAVARARSYPHHPNGYSIAGVPTSDAAHADSPLFIGSSLAPVLDPLPSPPQTPMGSDIDPTTFLAVPLRAVSQPLLPRMDALPPWNKRLLCYRVHSKLQPYLHQVLRHMVLTSFSVSPSATTTGENTLSTTTESAVAVRHCGHCDCPECAVYAAVMVANACRSHLFFPVTLELLLYASVEEDEEQYKRYKLRYPSSYSPTGSARIGSAHTQRSESDPSSQSAHHHAHVEASPYETAINAVKTSSVSHASGSGDNTALTTHNHTTGSHPASVVSPPPFLPKLKTVVAFLRRFPEYLDIVVNCARKVDAYLWPRLFAFAGTPSALVEQCLQSHNYETACAYLLVVQRTQGLTIARQLAVRILNDSLVTHSRENLKLTRAITAFLRAHEHDVPEASSVAENEEEEGFGEEYLGMTTEEMDAERLSAMQDG